MPEGGLVIGGVAAQSRIALRTADDAKLPRIARLLGSLISTALLVVVAMQVLGLGMHQVFDMVPTSPLFWGVFLIWYTSGPASEWIIYRRLWDLPAGGFGALVRKMISSELLLGYLGEAQFYAWARGRMSMEAAPFGTIKDVTILSALAGNMVTLAMLVASLPLVFSETLTPDMRPVFLSLGIALVSSLLILIFRNKIFSLPRSALQFIMLLHLGRIMVQVVLGMVLWHLALPEVAIEFWLVLATLRMLVSRLPLLPNKEIVFTGLGAFLVASHFEIASLLAMIGGIVIIAHLCVGAGFGGADLLDTWGRPRNAR